MEELSIIGVGNLGSPCLLILLSYTILKDSKMNLRLIPCSHLLEGELIQWQWADKAKNVQIIVHQLPTKAG